MTELFGRSYSLVVGSYRLPIFTFGSGSKNP